MFDPNRSLVFDVKYKKAPIFKHDGCEVHHGVGGVSHYGYLYLLSVNLISILSIFFLVN